MCCGFEILRSRQLRNSYKKSLEAAQCIDGLLKQDPRRWMSRVSADETGLGRFKPTREQWLVLTTFCKTSSTSLSYTSNPEISELPHLEWSARHSLPVITSAGSGETPSLRSLPSSRLPRLDPASEAGLLLLDAGLYWAILGSHNSSVEVTLVE